MDAKYKLVNADQMHRLLNSGGSTTPRSAARQIINGVINGKERVLVGTDAKIMDILARISPWFVHTKVGLVTSLAGSFLDARFVGRRLIAATILLVLFGLFKR